jgi:arabinan endo-1,5-alpha-L-arabinosidase
MKKNNIHMKKVLGSALVFAFIWGMISCTDVQGDGLYTVVWEGSVVPQDSCYRNPVWEPDLTYPTVFKAAVGYYAFGADNEWSAGLDFTAPVLSSTDLMSWRSRGEAFVEKPSWSDGPISAISAGFAKTKGTYYIFYELDGEGIGMGGSKAPQGPFDDFGLLLDSEVLGLAECSNPFFFAFGSKAYVFFQGGDGMYGQELVLNKTDIADLMGEKFKVTGSAIQTVNMIKFDAYYYLFGSVEDGDNSRITLGLSTDITGPFTNKEGSSLLDGEGTTLLTGNAENGFVAVNHVGGVIEDANDDIWVLYQAVDVDSPTLSTGTDRHPLLLSRIEFDENGWPLKIFEAMGGWNHPKFAK